MRRARPDAEAQPPPTIPSSTPFSDLLDGEWGSIFQRAGTHTFDKSGGQSAAARQKDGWKQKYSQGTAPINLNDAIGSRVKIVNQAYANPLARTTRVVRDPALAWERRNQPAGGSPPRPSGKSLTTPRIFASIANPQPSSRLAGGAHSGGQPRDGSAGAASTGTFSSASANIDSGRPASRSRPTSSQQWREPGSAGDSRQTALVPAGAKPGLAVGSSSHRSLALRDARPEEEKAWRQNSKAEMTQGVQQEGACLGKARWVLRSRLRCKELSLDALSLASSPRFLPATACLSCFVIITPLELLRQLNGTLDRMLSGWRLARARKKQRKLRDTPASRAGTAADGSAAAASTGTAAVPGTVKAETATEPPAVPSTDILDDVVDELEDGLAEMKIWALVLNEVTTRPQLCPSKALATLLSKVGNNFAR